MCNPARQLLEITVLYGGYPWHQLPARLAQMVSRGPLAHSTLSLLLCSLHTCTQEIEISLKLNTSACAGLHQHWDPR